MKRVLIFLIATLPLTTLAQQNTCGFDRHLDHMISEDPSLIQDILEHQDRVREIKEQRLGGETSRAGGPRIIPTVFHVIHQGGDENISMEQIEDQMRILNEDYRRLNADASETRAEFLAVAADANVEFRLAKLDPQNNCTDGVVRVMSPLTFNATDAVKSLSYWNSSKYFNVWVVATIDSDGEPGTILGYAQFPGFGAAETDGVVLRANYTGSIETGASSGYMGRVLTHEAGHWLGLFHTFQGGCTGGWPFGEGIDDTPPVAAATNGGCPHNANTCSNDNPDLPDQVENYMDYSSGSCQNMFTLGQKDVMDAVLNGSRSQIHSSGNLNSTGVLLSTTPCQPYAHFYAEETIVCTDNDITFTDDSYNGEVTTYDWQLPGATPSSSSDENPTVSYASPGLYSVTLNVSNAQGSDTYARTDYIRVLPAAAEGPGWFSFEGFEEQNEDYIVFSDGLGNTWQETSSAFTGEWAIKIVNFSGNPVDSEDEFLLPAVDLTQMNSPKLYFKRAYQERSGGEDDNLRVFVSRDCGENWSMRYNKSGGSLATVNGTTGSSFAPGSTSDWEETEVNLSSFSSDEHVLVKFRNKSDVGNNVYIDDIQISGPQGIRESHSGFELAISPNPTSGSAFITAHPKKKGHFTISVTDITGKLVAEVYSGLLSATSTSLEIPREALNTTGVYLVRVQSSDGIEVRKLIVQ